MSAAVPIGLIILGLIFGAAVIAGLILIGILIYDRAKKNKDN